MKPGYYHTIGQSARGEFRERGSTFIAYALPVESLTGFKAELAAIKKEHPKATHHCFAYRLGTDGNNFRSSDDGEPPGSAGRPILGQLDSRELTNTLVVVVRYFGGSLLGVPGLIHAYKTAASQALDAAAIVELPITADYELDFEYQKMNEVMRIVKQFDCRVLGQEWQLFCRLRLAVPKVNAEGFEKRIREIKDVEFTKPG